MISNDVKLSKIIYLYVCPNIYPIWPEFSRFVQTKAAILKKIDEDNTTAILLNYTAELISFCSLNLSTLCNGR